MKPKMDRILVTADGSPESEEAFAAMMPIVRADEPEVTVLYVDPDPKASFSPPARIAKACVALRANGVNAHLAIREGKPAEEIARLSQTMDLLVMSTHGHGALKRLVLGSVTEAVIRRTPTPLLITRPGVRPRPWTRMVVALDGSPRGEQILDSVVPLARRLHASVELVQAAFPPITMTGLGDVGGAQVFEDPLPYLARVQTRLAAEAVTASIHALEGRAASEILRHVEQHGATLLCLATHGRGGLARVLLGSIAEEVIRHAPCPVLLRRSVPVESGPSAVPIPVGC